MKIAEFESKTGALTVTNNRVSENTEISIGHYGFENTPPNKGCVKAKDYPTFRLHYVIHGSLTLVVNGKTIPLKKEHCFLLRPDVDVQYKTNPNDPASFYWISVSGQKCKTYFSEMGFSGENCQISVPKECRKPLRQAFFDNFQVGEPLKEIIGSVFMLNFIKIYQQLYLATHKIREEKPAVGFKQKAYIEQALEYINRHYSDPQLTIKEVAQSMFLHENYLSHIFRVAMGLPFREYLTQKRIEMSCSFMKEGMTSINKIAELVGFSDALYFSKVFKRYNGISPREHLKKLNKATSTT